MSWRSVRKVFVAAFRVHVGLYARAARFLTAFFNLVTARWDIVTMRDDAFERLYAEHAQALFGFLSYRTGDRVLAEDLLADTFERALRARRRFDPRKASVKTWLYAIALNCLRDSGRRRSAEGRALERVSAGASEWSSDRSTR